jgi:SET domain-containing protein
VAPNLYLGPDVSPEEKDDPGDVVNHSCDPNSKIVIYGSGLFQPLVSCLICLVAIRDIAAGEEITYDYEATMYDDPWTMKCNCGLPCCRGVIGGR